MTHDMNRTEIALLLALALAAQAHAGQIAVQARYRDVTPDEVRAIMMRIEDVLTDVIVGMRAPGPAPTPDEIAEVVRTVAMAAVEKVLGEPPAPETLH